MSVLIWFLLLGGAEVSVAGRTPTLLYFDFALISWLTVKVICTDFWPDFSGRIFRLAVFFIVTGTLSGLVNLEGAYRSLATLKVFVIGMIVYGIARRRSVNGLLLSAWGAVVATILLVHYWEALNSFSLMSFRSLDINQLNEVKGRVVTIMGQGDYIDSMLLLLTPVTVAQTLVHSGWRRLLFAGFSVVTLGGIFATLSRGAIASLALCLAACVPLFRKSGAWRRFLPTIVPIGLVLILFIATGVFQQALELVDYRLNNVDVGREEIMLAALDAIRDNPILGVGPGQVGIAISRRVVGPGGVLDNRAQFISSHNIILDALAENGLLAGSALLAMVALVLRAAWKQAVADPNPINIGLFAGVLGAVLMTMVEGPFLGEQFQVIFWTVAGMIKGQGAMVGRPLRIVRRN